MVELLFCVALLAGILALGMYKAPLLVWAGALALAALVWSSDAVHGHTGLFGALLFLGFWNKRLGILGALGSCFSFVATVTIIPFMPEGWAASAGGFPAMTERVAFLMKDLVLLAVSFYLLKQDLVRMLPQRKDLPEHVMAEKISAAIRASRVPQSG